MNKKEIAFFAGCIILGMVISVILSKTSISDKTHEFKCVSIQDYEGGDYSPEHYYSLEGDAQRLYGCSLYSKNRFSNIKNNKV